MDKRPAIPKETRRAVLVEAGHRCAIPRCNETNSLEIHHITPWNKCQKHEYQNLIALCPTCHRRADKKEIDEKSLKIYKEKLKNKILKKDYDSFSGEVIEKRRRMSKLANGKIGIPGFEFQFDFPEFNDKVKQIVTRNIEAWAHELLIEVEQRHENYDLDPNDAWVPHNDILKGEYKITRMDNAVISVKYSIFRYSYGAAHGYIKTKVQNFLLKPFFPITLIDLLSYDLNSLKNLSLLIRKKLLSDNKFNSDDVIRGTEPKFSNFKLFNFKNNGIIFTFVEYQIGCYAIGQTKLFINYEEMKDIIKPEIYQTLANIDLIDRTYI